MLKYLLFHVLLVVRRKGLLFPFFMVVPLLIYFVFGNLSSGQVQEENNDLLHNRTLDGLTNQKYQFQQTPFFTTLGDPSDLIMIGKDHPLDLRNRTLYISNTFADTISVIDETTHIIKEHIPVGDDPNDLETFGDFLYVANEGSDTVSVISTLNNTVINTINVGKEPQYLLQHGSKIYVTNYADRSISVIDANRNSVIKNITVGESPRQLERISIFSPYLYVLNENSDHISVINLTSDEVIKNITVGDGQYYFASTPKKLYTSDGEKISVVNLTTGTITKNITLDSPGEMKIYGDKLYAINYPNSVSVINRTTDEVIKNITVGESPFDIISPYYGNEGSDRKLYVANFQSKSVSVIDRITDEVIKNITVGDDPNNLRSYLDALYVFGENTDGIYVIDMIKDELVAGVVLNVFPKNAGSIMCPDVNPPLNQFIYVHSTTKCVAKPNKGFEFLSWNEILDNNSTRTLMTSQNNNFILKSVADLFNIPLVDNNASLNMTQFGKFTANFRELSPPLPPEYLLGLYTLAATVFTGWFVPNIARHISTHRQKRHMLDYIGKLDKLEKNNENVKILEETQENIIKSFAKGEISEIQYKLIMEKISDMKNNRT